MIIIPAIDMIDGQAVRLYKGAYNQKTIYGTPKEKALEFKALGAHYVHLVDLDAAKEGTSNNLKAIKDVVASGLSVELGGGVRSLSKIKELFSLGLERVILGSIAITNPDIVKEAIKVYGPRRIIIGIDSKDGYVATHGWLETSPITSLDCAQHMESLGAKTIIFTDISKDGTLLGPSLNLLKELIDHTSLNVIASGGIRTQEDLEECRAIGCFGVIVGKSIYEGTLDLKKALEIEATYAM